MKISYTHTVALLLGAIIGALGVVAYMSSLSPTAEEIIADYYAVENAVSVSPHTLRTMMDQGRADEFVIVDLRSAAEYEQEHVISALNVPGSGDPATDTQRIVNAFEEIIAENPNEDIIIYCYSHACTLADKVGQLLAENGIYVKHLNIGWNEWRTDWQMWNGAHEDAATVLEYIHSGKEPGVPQEKEVAAPCSEGELTC